MKIEELEKAEAQIKALKESNRQLENFAYIASHDLKSPIGSIRSYITYLQIRKSETFDQETKELLDTIAHICESALKLLTELLEHSKIKKSPENFKDHKLVDLVEEAILNLKDLIKDKRAIVETDPVLKDLNIYCDGPLIISLFQNLISNGIKFNKSINPIVRVGGLGPYLHNDKYTIFVQDNGIGIDVKDRERIFEMFRKGPSDRSGFGIGLNVVKKVLEIHDQRIWVDSKLEKGTTFYFNLKKGRKHGQESDSQRQGPASKV